MTKGKSIEITQEYEDWVKENLRYDPDTGYLWWVKQNIIGTRPRNLDYPAGAKSLGYLILNIYLPDKATTLRCHRIAWFLHYGVWPKKHIDHINGIKDDNRIMNLREANPSENGGNSIKRKNYGGKPSTSRYKGVSLYRPTNRWVANIMVNGKAIYLGYYDNQEEAALAYNKAALEHFGEYAKINIIEPLDTGMTNTYISSSSGELTY